MTFYGSKTPPPGDYIPDWLMGGNRKRRILEALMNGADPKKGSGWSADDLATHFGFGRSTVYETIRALRAMKVIDESGGLVLLDTSTPIGAAIEGLIKALRPFDKSPVDRPPRPRQNRAATTAGTRSQPSSSASAPGRAAVARGSSSRDRPTRTIAYIPWRLPTLVRIKAYISHPIGDGIPPPP